MSGERCHLCGAGLPERSPNSPALRRCQSCFEAANAGEPWMQRLARVRAAGAA